MSDTDPQSNVFEDDEKSKELAGRGTEESLGIDNTDTALSPENAEDLEDETT